MSDGPSIGQDMAEVGGRGCDFLAQAEVKSGALASACRRSNGGGPHNAAFSKNSIRRVFGDQARKMGNCGGRFTRRLGRLGLYRSLLAEERYSLVAIASERQGDYS